MNNYSVSSLLKDYQLNKSKLRLLDYKGQQQEQIVQNLTELKEIVERLDYCIACLPEEEKNIITNIFIKRMSIRNIGKTMIMARTTVTRKRDQAIKLLENLLKSC